MKISARALLNFCCSPKNIIYYLLPAALMLMSLVYGVDTYLLNRYARQLQEVLHPSNKDVKTVSCSFVR